MKKLYCVILSLATFTPYIYSQAYIPYNCRVINEAPGFCCWAAIETAARAQGIARLCNLKESRKIDSDGYIQRAVPSYTGQLRIVDGYYVPRYGGTIDSVLHKFSEMGYTSYRYQRMGNLNLGLIYDALRRGHGVVIQVNWQDMHGAGCHAVLLTELTPYYVKFINSNNLQEEVRSRAWFQENWDGFAITLDGY